jgi:hypothetical protein
MWSLRRRTDKHESAGTALADAPRGRSEQFAGTDQELLAEIGRLVEANRIARSPDVERRLIALRHEAGVRIMDSAAPNPRHPEPDFDKFPITDGLPEFAPDEVSPELLRAGILRHGCLLVRGLIPREAADRFAAEIERAYEERARMERGEPAAEGYYEEFGPDLRFAQDIGRPWVKEGGGLLASDSPKLSFEMLEMFRAAALPELVSSYLGETALSSLQKTTLRKAEPSVGGAWHQDGSFMGPVRSLNLWLSLSRCGDESPGLDIIPRRFDYLVRTGTDEAVFDMQVSQAKAREAAGDVGIIRPIFEPGDALLFDELFLHQTGSDPSMPKPRFAIESWFFGGSRFPADYAPIAV